MASVTRVGLLTQELEARGLNIVYPIVILISGTIAAAAAAAAAATTRSLRLAGSSCYRSAVHVAL